MKRSDYWSIIVAIATASITIVGNRMLFKELQVYFESAIIAREIAYIIVELFVGSIVYLIYSKKIEKKTRSTLVCKSWELRKDGTFAGILLNVGIGCIVAVLTCFTNADYIIRSNFTVEPHTGKELFLLSISMILVAPIVEELTMRGILMNTLWRSRGLKTSVVISSVCFGIMHGTSFTTVAFAILFGVIVAFVYAANRSILDSIFVHAAHNAYIVLSMVVPRSSLGFSNTNLPITILISVMLVGIVILYETCLWKKYKRKVLPRIEVDPW